MKQVKRRIQLVFGMQSLLFVVHPFLSIALFALIFLRRSRAICSKLFPTYKDSCFLKLAQGCFAVRQLFGRYSVVCARICFVYM